MKILALFMFIFLMNILCYSQSNDLLNRNAFTLKLAVDGSNFYQAEIKESPYLLPENTIKIYPGETLFVEIELLKKNIKGMKIVKENLNPEKTLIIKFYQETNGKKHEMMMLYIKNPFKRELVYSAYMCLMKNSKWVPTSVIPIKPELRSFETWPDIILTLALSGWEFKD